MITTMIGGKTTCSIVITLVAVLTGCSSDNDDAQPPISVAETSPTTNATTAPEPTTTVATPTSLSDNAKAEAEIAQMVTDWWTKGYDPAHGEPDGGLEYLTGLIVVRTNEFLAANAEKGIKLVSRGGELPIEITDIQVDLDKERGTVDFCGGSDIDEVDIETGEPVEEGDDPSYLTTSKADVELTEDGWKISEWYPSFNTEPVECEIENQR